jgi:hypothetical protein
MWLFTRYGFFSISPARETIVMRARRKSHLHRLQSRFPKLAAEIEPDEEGDCRFRLVASKDDWAAAVAALAEESAGGSGDTDALQRAWDEMYGIEPSGRQRALVEWSEDGAIGNAIDLTADDLAGQRVLCPECARKVFVSWPEGWDAHAAYACEVAGATPEERKANYKDRYRRLFR